MAEITCPTCGGKGTIDAPDTGVHQLKGAMKADELVGRFLQHRQAGQAQDISDAFNQGRPDTGVIPMDPNVIPGIQRPRPKYNSYPPVVLGVRG
jgi:hypothetical protein